MQEQQQQVVLLIYYGLIAYYVVHVLRYGVSEAAGLCSSLGCGLDGLALGRKVHRFFHSSLVVEKAGTGHVGWWQRGLVDYSRCRGLVRLLSVPTTFSWCMHWICTALAAVHAVVGLSQLQQLALGSSRRLRASTRS